MTWEELRGMKSRKPKVRRRATQVAGSPVVSLGLLHERRPKHHLSEQQTLGFVSLASCGEDLSGSSIRYSAVFTRYSRHVRSSSGKASEV